MEATTSRVDQLPAKNGHNALYTGGIAALLASTCHHIAFLLVTLGLSSAKILYIVTLADWSRPFFIAVSIIALCISYRHIWQVSSTHRVVRDSTTSRTKVTEKAFFSFIAMLVIMVLMLPYFAPCTE